MLIRQRGLLEGGANSDLSVNAWHLFEAVRLLENTVYKTFLNSTLLKGNVSKI